MRYREHAIRATGALGKLIEMADLADRLAADHGPIAYKALRRLGGRIASAEGDLALREAVAQQKIIRDGLDRLERLMVEWQSYEGIVRFFKGLRDKQRGFLDDLEGINKSEKPGDD